ncbi:MAG: DUF454 family protein [Pseudomonadales bacterium]
MESTTSLTSRARARKVNSPMKVIYLVVGALLLALGLIGLVIPIIPGILFLIAAVYVLGKVSRRVRRWGQNNHTYRSVSSRFERMGHVSVLDRIKVTGLMIAGGLASSIDIAVHRINRLFQRVVG